MYKEIEDYQIKGISKIINTPEFLSIYPMIDHIEVKKVPDKQIISYVIFLNTDEINNYNMYGSGLDPHYLVDFYIRKYYPYLEIGIGTGEKVTIFNKSGVRIYSSF